MTLSPSTAVVTTSKTSVKRGETVVIRARQFGAGTILSISIGGAFATLNTTDTKFATNQGSNSLTFTGSSIDVTITVPTTAPLGTQRVAVASTNETTRNVNIEVVGAPLTLSPSTAVIAQSITVSGSGFTGGTDVSRPTGATTQCTNCQFSIGGTVIVSSGINGNALVTTDNSGNMVATVVIPSTTQTQTAGSYTFQVTDEQGRTGQATITIPSRTLTLDTTSSRRGSTVTVTGSGFPASSSVSFTYAGTAVGSTTPDSVGGFTTTFTVPTTAGIPSSNSVIGTSSTNSLTGTVTHAVPGATITVAEASAVSGSTITITGAGFPGFATLTVLSIGGVSAVPTPAPATDSNGDITATALVPQLATGTQAVLVTVGGTTANTSVTITATPAVVVVTTTATETVFADEIASDNLVRVWRFSNADQSWSFYDPRPAFAAANTLTETSSGDIVWVNVTAETTFQGATLYPGGNLISLN